MLLNSEEAARRNECPPPFSSILTPRLRNPWRNTKSSDLGSDLDAHVRCVNGLFSATGRPPSHDIGRSPRKRILQNISPPPNKSSGQVSLEDDTGPWHEMQRTLVSRSVAPTHIHGGQADSILTLSSLTYTFRPSDVNHGEAQLKPIAHPWCPSADAADLHTTKPS